MEKKYAYSEPTKEEQEGFAKEFEGLLATYSMVASTVPTYQRVEGTDGFVTKGMLFLQKRIELVEAEKTSEEGIPSDNPEVNPILSDENTETAQ